MSKLKDSLNELYKLQLIDNEIIENIRHLKRLESSESESKNQFEELQEQKAKIDAEVKPIKDKADEIKDENVKHTEKKKDCEDRLFNADTDPRDLQFLQKEREQYMSLIRKNEDEIVRLMVNVDSVEIRKSEINEKLKELEPEYNQEVKQNKETVEKLNLRVEELKKERQEFKNFEDKSLLAMYQKLQKENDGLAIATVSDDVCEGCFVEMSMSTLQQIEEMEEIVICPRCGRILFTPERVEIEP